MQIGSTTIEDTFAEGFSTRVTRLVVTAESRHWLEAAIAECCGYGSSVIGCDAEAGLESWIPPAETLDGRPGASLLMFAFSSEALKKAAANRTGQCLMTCPTTAVFDGLHPVQHADRVTKIDAYAAGEIPLGKQLRFFGDGFQKSKLIDERRFWRVPVMDGEFIVEDRIGLGRGVAGGNFLIMSEDQTSGLAAAEAAVEALKSVPGVILPFPGGVVRSGSKVGSRYSKLVASTADAYCPTLRGRVETRLPPGAGCVYEIVIDGLTEADVAAAMKVGIEAACRPGVISIGAGNYGGKLGKHHFHLHEVMASTSSGVR